MALATGPPHLLRAGSAAGIGPRLSPTEASSPHGAGFAWLCNKGFIGRDVLL